MRVLVQLYQKVLWSKSTTLASSLMDVSLTHLSHVANHSNSKSVSVKSLEVGMKASANSKKVKRLNLFARQTLLTVLLVLVVLSHQMPPSTLMSKLSISKHERMALISMLARFLFYYLCKTHIKHINSSFLKLIYF